ncbi:MAG: (2Fe-2S)-binding protein [Acidobacteria bacterium]|nr:(2Fe-2S)-binding protein [Acidobacteriota bacterium]
MWICLCEAVTSTTIREVIEDGAASVGAVAEACGAGTVCGKCKRTIAVMVDQHSPAEKKRFARWR